MKRKLTLAITAVALAALMVIGGTLAWFTDSKSVTNKASFSNLGIDLTETFGKIENGQTIDADDNTVDALMPGDTLFKKPVVTNTKASDVLLKVTLTYGGTLFEKDAALLNDVKAAIDTNVWTTPVVSETDKTITFYKKTVLAATNTTDDKDVATIFDFSKKYEGKDWGNAIQDADFSLAVKVDAVQATNMDTNNDGTFSLEELAAAFTK
ncbi:hypothetical protein lbkm_3279 [Lachnospiraceae bacterium KM106-2]|nr:hypothetical protein lbkm_3279 [Lachnospiraceae bacterium KM106-2]